MNIFVTGESGTIPLQIQRLAKNYKIKVINTQLEDNFLTPQKTHQSFKVRKPELDFLNRDLFLEYESLWEKVDLIVHSGAFVGTDFCTSNPSLAIQTNVEGTYNIVATCNKYDIPLIYLSTTAILDPNKYDIESPMKETTPINPQTIYGISKYAGELIVKNVCKTKRFVLRPVFGFGDYPEDLHSALTKVIYVIFRNVIGIPTTLTVLLNKSIPKSYTRVENIATCILQFINNFNDPVFDQPITSPSYHTFNVGENYKNAKNWHQILEIISNEFERKGISTRHDVIKIFHDQIEFQHDKDYLHFHNMDDSRLRLIGLDFESQDDYVAIEKGISMVIDSVIKNIDQEPYWLE
jgi:dTDP-4-dehydrorhamnose reductase